MPPPVEAAPPPTPPATKEPELAEPTAPEPPPATLEEPPPPPSHAVPFHMDQAAVVIRDAIGVGVDTVRRRRWTSLGVAAGVLALGVWWWFAAGPGRRNAAMPEHFVPLAAELEGIRGVYLYFGVPGSDSMMAEYRDIVVKDRSSDRVRAIYRELIAGPTGGTSPFPDGTELLNTYETARGTLYLDWNRTFVTGFRGGTGHERQILSSIVLTAGDNLPEVQHVVILVEGNPVPTLGGHYDILAPLDVADWR
ncbi:MAG TPA: GerMN domain-containing protein [Candidatus Eisenbacteria bacterium]